MSPSHANRSRIAAFVAIFRRHQEEVRRFLRSRAAEPSEIDDLLQDTFIAAALAAGSFAADETTAKALRSIASQLLKRRRRSSARFRAMIENLGRLPLDDALDPEREAATRATMERLREAVGELSREQRRVLVMVEWSGLPGIEVARCLAIPVGTVWRRLHDARVQLRARVVR